MKPNAFLRVTGRLSPGESRLVAVQPQNIFRPEEFELHGENVEAMAFGLLFRTGKRSVSGWKTLAVGDRVSMMLHNKSMKESRSVEILIHGVTPRMRDQSEEAGKVGEVRF